MSSHSAQVHQLLLKASGLASRPENLSKDVKEATVQLDALFKQGSQVLPALVEVMLSAPEEQVKQLAAVEARKLVNKQKAKVWIKVPQATRQIIKANILQRLAQSQATSSNLSNGMARVVAAIARIEMSQQLWPELLPWTWQAASSQEPQQRETGLYVLFALIDTFVEQAGGASFASHSPQIYTLLAGTLQDSQSLKVRVLSVRILGRMIEYVEPTDVNDLKTLQSTIPSLVQVAEQVLAEDDETLIRHVFDVIDTLSFSDSPIINDSFTELIRFLLQAGANTNYSSEARLAPLNALLFLVKYKKSKVQSQQLARPILEALLPIGAEEEPEDNDEDSAARVAFRIVDCLANNLPPSQVVDPLIQLCQQYSGSQSPGLRKAAIMSFGVIFEGCSLYIVNLMDQLWPFVDQCLADSDASVRKAACMALSFMCDMVGEVCAKRHAVLLPHLVELVNHDVTRRYALNALDSLLEVLGKDIIPYLASLMERLLALLPILNMEVKGSVVGAVGSAAHAAKAAFTPYFQAAMTQMLPFLQMTEEDTSTLRGITQDTVGTLAEAVGKDAFGPYFEQVMHCAFEGTKLEGGNMRECSYIYFATMSRVYKEDFAQFLPTLIPLLLASLQQDDKSENAAVAAAAEGFDSRTETPQPGGDDDDEELYEDLDDEDLEEALMGINSAVATEKETACNALDEIFENTGMHFLPYVQKSVQGFQILFEHFNESLRKASMIAALDFIETANKLANPPKWLPSVNPVPLQSDVKALVHAVVPVILQCWQEEDDRDVSTALCDTFSSVIMEVGPAVVAPAHLETICKLTLDILEKKSPCQIDDGDQEAELNAEQSEWDAHLIRGAGDLVSSLAIAVGPEFAPAFNSFLPALATYVDPKRQPGERSSAIGALAESINGLKEGVTSLTENLYQLFTNGLRDPDLDVRSNSAFAIGSLIFQTQKDLSSEYLNVLSGLQPLFDRTTNSEESNQACDNACGAVARLLLKCSAALPLDQVLPLWLDNLPIRQDFAENAKVIEASIDLLQKGTAGSSAQRIFSVISQVMQQQHEAGADTKPLLPETEARIQEFLRQLSSSDLQASGLQSFLGLSKTIDCELCICLSFRRHAKTATIPMSSRDILLKKPLLDAQSLVSVDYVLIYDCSVKEKTEYAQVEKEYQSVLEALRTTGLTCTSRPGAPDTGEVLIFVKADDQRLHQEVRVQGLNDWLGGITSIQRPDPRQARDFVQEPLIPSERLRIVYDLITSLPDLSKDQPGSGAGITADSDRFSRIKGIFPPHDPKFNQEWLSSWTSLSTTVSIPEKQLLQIRDHFGENIALYFEFLRFYFAALLFPMILGLLTWSLSLEFSPLYSILIVFWSLLVVEGWRFRERVLAVRWGSRNANSTGKRRTQFRGDTSRQDPITGRMLQAQVWWKKELRILVSFPIILAFGAGLFLLITAIFFFEVLINEAYDGTGKQYLSLLPTVLFAGLVPQVVAIWQKVAYRLTNYEDHEHQGSYEKSLTLKTFCLSAIPAFGNLTLSAYVYIPFGRLIVPRLLEFLHFNSPEAVSTANLARDFSINPSRLRNTLFALTTTTQAIGAFTETVLPLLMRLISRKVSQHKGNSNAKALDDPQEACFLDRIRKEAALPQYSLFGDYAELAQQFGYITLWSVVWPLVPLTAFVNNFFELRGDAFKICVNQRRPIPQRVETVGPWLETLGFLTWLGAFVNASLVYMFKPRAVSQRGFVAEKLLHAINGTLVAQTSISQSPFQSTPVFQASISSSHAFETVRSTMFTALLVGLASEHAYLATLWLVRRVMEHVFWKDSPEKIGLMKNDYILKRQYLEAMDSNVTEGATQIKPPADSFWRSDDDPGLAEIRRLQKMQ